MPEDFTDIKKRSESVNDSIVTSGQEYPWGTSIRFEDDMVDDLGIEALKPGDVVRVSAFAFVDHKHEDSGKDHTSKGLSLQFTAMKIQREEDDKVEQLYGGD